MNKLPTSIKENVDFGWSIQVYNSDRRLVASLDPSHAWASLLGVVLGFCLTLTYINAVPTESNSPVIVEPDTEHNAPIKID